MLEQGIRNPEYGADKFGFTDLEAVNWNLLEPELYERALTGGEAQLTSGGALCAETGAHNDGEFYVDKHFGFQVPTAVKDVDSRILRPRETWSDKEAFDIAARKLVQMFKDNFAKFESVVHADVMAIAMSA